MTFEIQDQAQRSKNLEKRRACNDGNDTDLALCLHAGLQRLALSMHSLLQALLQKVELGIYAKN